MPYGIIAADTLQSSTANTAPVFRDGNSTEIGRLCRAFIYFTVSGSTPTTASFFNISSVTYVSAGRYTLAFTANMPDVNFIITGSTNLSNPAFAYWGGTKAVTGFDTAFSTGTFADVAVFR